MNSIQTVLGRRDIAGCPVTRRLGYFTAYFLVAMGQCLDWKEYVSEFLGSVNKVRAIQERNVMGEKRQVRDQESGHFKFK